MSSTDMTRNEMLRCLENKIPEFEPDIRPDKYVLTKQELQQLARGIARKEDELRILEEQYRGLNGESE